MNTQYLFFASVWLAAFAGCGDDSASGGAASGASGPGGTDTGGADTGGAGGTGGSSQGGSGGAGGGGTFAAVHGEFCAPEDLIGRVRLDGFPQAVVRMELFDKPNPHIGPAELTTPTCAYHQFDPGSCGACEPGETCSSVEGMCVPERRTIKDGTLVVTAAGASQMLMTDSTLGGLYGDLTVGSATDAFEMALTFGDSEVTLAPMNYQGLNLDALTMTTETMEFDAPGAVDVTWVPAAEGHVLSLIPINHHAAGPTFTFCAAQASSGAFHAEAEMIDPLAVITGLEFQGVEYVNVAAAELPQGCVEFQFGHQQFPN